MNRTDITEEIELIIEAGDAEDALDLARRLSRQGDTAWAVDVRRSVTRGALDRHILRAFARKIDQPAIQLDLDLLGRLADADEGLRALLAAEAATPLADRRERNARQWTMQQRYQERVTTYNEQVEHVNRERGRAHNKAQAAAVRAKTCTECFQVPAASGACGC
ncbi:hypothetical protein QFZ66_005872 [Streptomyces sp. B4I13]|uniref:hypothetical protein n=1 Tax=Streptomyces sp. B4I13 TaxID=3042271 RepID=UPI00277D478E|nr:hypothetical protein [Streptomyces sp. B4I13]MDQ0961994.1 hypothetical protein [Streptomyces sp. B4I13]